MGPHAVARVSRGLLPRISCRVFHCAVRELFPTPGENSLADQWRKGSCPAEGGLSPRPPPCVRE